MDFGRGGIVEYDGSINLNVLQFAQERSSMTRIEHKISWRDVAKSGFGLEYVQAKEGPVKGMASSAQPTYMLSVDKTW
jgi:hypothetical protein